MSYTIDWANKIVHIPKSDLEKIDDTHYKLDLMDFKKTIDDIMDNTDGIVNVDIIKHFTSVTIGGTTYAPMVEIINDYTVTFEAGEYSVDLYGANSNIIDKINYNGVSILANNAAGLVTINYDDFINKLNTIANAASSTVSVMA